jgi:hypothetical protein
MSAAAVALAAFRGGVRRSDGFVLMTLYLAFVALVLEFAYV